MDTIRIEGPLPPHIPDYELLRPIGHGSYGEVWLARSVTGAYRAIKVVYRRSFDSERPYEREFVGIQKFEPISRGNPTQIPVLHAGRNDAAGFFFYVMELADDQKTGQQISPDSYTPRTLRSELQQQGRLSLRECLGIGLQLVTALEHLHKNGLVHRDVKPSNIVFVDGKPKLADIGLVTSLDAAKSFVGTEGYIPPEGPGTPQADLFSLGKVVYEISTGRDRLDFPELPTNLKDLPEKEALVQLNEVVLKACHEDRSRRYQTADEMRADLLALESSKALAGSKPWAQSQSRALPIKILAAGALAVCLFFAIKSLLPVGPRSKPSGLIACWTGDGYALDSAGTNTAALQGGADYAPGIAGQAFHLNGSTAFVSAPNSPLWRFGTNDFSIGLWANFSAPVREGAFLACDDGPATRNKWIFWLNDRQLRLHVFNPQARAKDNLGSALFSPTAGQWYHLAVTRSGSLFSFYINGAVVSTNISLAPLPAVSAPLTIGSAEGGNFFNGLLSDVRIYNRALSAAELRDLVSSVNTGTNRISSPAITVQP